jgi:hypothetical protein
VIQRAETLKKAVLYRLWTAKNFPGGLEKQVRETVGGGGVGGKSSGGLDKQAREGPGEENTRFVFPGGLDKQGREPPGDLGNSLIGVLDRQAQEAPGEESMGLIFPVGLNKQARATPVEGHLGRKFSGGLEKQARQTPEARQGAAARSEGEQRMTEPKDVSRVDKSASVSLGKSEGTRGSLAEPSAEGPVGAAGPSTQLVPYQGAAPLVTVQGPPMFASRSRFKRTSKMVTTDASLRKDLILNKLQVSKAGCWVISPPPSRRFHLFVIASNPVPVSRHLAKLFYAV